jgi:hypothetical protein
MTNKDKATELYRSWLALVKLKEDMGRKVLEIAAHPDAPPNCKYLADAAPRYKDVVQRLRKHKPVVVAALNRLNPTLARQADEHRI